jgi:hypothetical protein
MFYEIIKIENEKVHTSCLIPHTADLVFAVPIDVEERPDRTDSPDKDGNTDAN